MSEDECPRDLCDGSGMINQYPANMAHWKSPQRVPCACASDAAIADAHARGVAEERARWVAACAEVFTAAQYYTDPNMGMAARDTVRNVKAHLTG